MEILLALLPVPLSGLLAAVLLHRAGASRWRIAAGAALAACVSLAVVVALWLVGFGQCFDESADRPSSWAFSPRREFCSDGSAQANVGVALTFVPGLVMALGTWLWERGRRVTGALLGAAALSGVLLPSAYVRALPLYRLDTYPVFHDPLLGAATSRRPATVCYVYGIQFGPRKLDVVPSTRRTCIVLRDTEKARALTSSYDEGVTGYDLEWVGRELARRGRPVRPGPTGFEDYEVARVFSVTDAEARRRFRPPA